MTTIRQKLPLSDATPPVAWRAARGGLMLNFLKRIQWKTKQGALLGHRKNYIVVVAQCSDGWYSFVGFRGGIPARPVYACNYAFREQAAAKRWAAKWLRGVA